MSSSKSVTIMTWNIYAGADFTPLVGTTPEEVPQRVSEIFRQFQATNFPVRAKAIAEQIARKKPDIIGLQEAVLWKLLSPQNGKIRVVYDFVSILLKELEKRDMHYEVIAEKRNTDAMVPSSTGFNVRFIDRDVILARKKSGLSFSNIMTESFENNLSVLVGGQSVTLLSGWASVNVKIDGKKFRLVNTHLEPLSPAVQIAQANELLLGPGATDLPLLFIGDFNSNADGSGTPTYNNLISAGFADAWIKAGKGDGFTCCQDADLLNLNSHLAARIDLILFRGDFKVKKVEVVGENQKDRTPTALWPSDHAGIVATLKFEGY